MWTPMWQYNGRWQQVTQGNSSRQHFEGPCIINIVWVPTQSLVIWHDTILELPCLSSWQYCYCSFPHSTYIYYTKGASSTPAAASLIVTFCKMKTWGMCPIFCVYQIIALATHYLDIIVLIGESFIRRAKMCTINIPPAVFLVYMDAGEATADVKGRTIIQQF